MIETRQQFDRRLAEAIALSERYKQDDGIAAVLTQLLAIREWTVTVVEEKK